MLIRHVVAEVKSVEKNKKNISTLSEQIKYNCDNFVECIYSIPHAQLVC